MTVVSLPEPAVVPVPGTVAAPVTDADVLERAADILSEFDWRQHSTGCRSEGSLCAMGAIEEAANDYSLSWFGDEVQRIFHMFGTPTQETRKMPLAAWNDEPGRTKQEVVQRLRDAAKQARNQPGK